jgi:hypothetical protein
MEAMEVQIPMLRSILPPGVLCRRGLDMVIAMPAAGGTWRSEFEFLALTSPPLVVSPARHHIHSTGGLLLQRPPYTSTALVAMEDLDKLSATGLPIFGLNTEHLEQHDWLETQTDGHLGFLY